MERDESHGSTFPVDVKLKLQVIFLAVLSIKEKNAQAVSVASLNRKRLRWRKFLPLYIYIFGGDLSNHAMRKIMKAK